MISSTQQYVDWFRGSSPYIHSHRGCTFVIYISGETIDHTGFAHLIHDKQFPDWDHDDEEFWDRMKERQAESIRDLCPKDYISADLPKKPTSKTN